jgi:uncharacterized RDD family membrane protein YckC
LRPGPQEPIFARDWPIRSELMPDSEPKRIGVTIELKPHAYDPATMPELFEGVLARRVVAFCIDLVLIATPALFVALFILVFGIFTLGLGWFFFILYWPGVVIWALVYYAIGFGSPASATIGMRVMDLEMRTWYGAPAYALLGAVHAILFWITGSALTPLVLLVAFFNARRRLLHDMLAGTIVINNEVRVDALRARRVR